MGFFIQTCTTLRSIVFFQEVLLNHNPEGKPWKPGEFQTLERLKLAIEYNQKMFVTHPSVQQLLAAIW